MKKLAAVSVFLWLLILGYVWYGTQDEAQFDDLGLLTQLMEVPESENGFLYLEYMLDEDFNVFENENFEFALDDMAESNGFDADLARELLNSSANILDDAKLANSTRYFSIPFSQNFPHGHLLNVNRLFLLSARLSIYDENYDQAIAALGDALTFSQRVKSEEGGTLISWLIGNNMLVDGLDLAHAMLTMGTLQEYQVDAILDEMAVIKPYFEDGFEKIFAGELQFARQLTTYNTSLPFFERVESLQDSEWLYIYDNPVKGALYEYLTAVFPAFYEHPNTISNTAARTWLDYSKYANSYCIDVGLEDEDVSFGEAEWIDFVLPNSKMNVWNRTKSGMKNYFIKRCFFHVYFDGVKVIAMLKKRQFTHGNSSQVMSEIISGTDGLGATDYFNGNALGYSEGNEWLYSVGGNYVDDGGSSQGVFFGSCYSHENCYTNPTMYIHRKKPLQEKSTACKAKFDEIEQEVEI